jgi:thiamine biosynthesis protein ThiS
MNLASTVVAGYTRRKTEASDQRDAGFSMRRRLAPAADPRISVTRGRTLAAGWTPRDDELWYTNRVPTPLAIVVNGSPRQVAAGTTVAGLLADLGLGTRVAVERNREIVTRARHAEVELRDGDRLELVTFVGGG